MTLSLLEEREEEKSVLRGKSPPRWPCWSLSTPRNWCRKKQVSCVATCVELGTYQLPFFLHPPAQSGKSGHPPPTPHSSSNTVTPPRRNPSSELGHAAAPKPPSSSTTPTYILHEFSLPHDHSGRSTTRSSRIDVAGHSRTSRSGISITTTESRGNSKQSSWEMFTTEVSGMHEVVPPCAVGRTVHSQ